MAKDRQRSQTLGFGWVGGCQLKSLMFFVHFASVVARIRVAFFLLRLCKRRPRRNRARGPRSARAGTSIDVQDAAHHAWQCSRQWSACQVAVHKMRLSVKHAMLLCSSLRLRARVAQLGDLQGLNKFSCLVLY
eukprot:170233-Amphidinium_carterae.1